MFVNFLYYYLVTQWCLLLGLHGWHPAPTNNKPAMNGGLVVGRASFQEPVHAMDAAVKPRYNTIDRTRRLARVTRPWA